MRRLRFTISRKIGFGFAVLLLTTLFIFVITYETLRTGRGINDKINTIYNPSVSSLEGLKSSVLRSRTLINMWAFVQSREDTKEKMSLVDVVQIEIPAIKGDIDKLSVNWSEAERRKKERIYNELDKLLVMYDKVQSTLGDMESYDDPFKRFSMTEYAEEDGLIFEQARIVIESINDLITEQRTNVTSISVEMIQSFNKLEGYLRNFGIVLFVFGVIIAIFTARSITKPAGSLKQILLELGKGKFPHKAVVDTGDEIGEMSIALDQLVSGLKRTSEFANQVGKGNFLTEYEPLSEEDVLGNALLLMRDGLRRNEQELEREVQDRTREVVKQKNKIEKQNEQRKELLDNITASIRYAKRLQENILPSDNQVAELLPESFVFYKPKDIVSGDFYLVREVREKILFSAVDCTGHGVPGAFMSLVGHNSLNRAIITNHNLDPAKILADLSQYATEAMNTKAHDSANRDGMDMALCVYDKKAGTIDYAGAYSPLYLIRNKELIIYKPNKIPIASPDAPSADYTSQRIKLEPNDMIYIFSDGYADQFGGRKGKKFFYSPFRKMLINIAELGTTEQKQIIAERMNTWRSDSIDGKKHEQVDDMLIIGVKHVG
ncbi:SpoIIE family protein phosphatase [Cryomorpha ignava]|uniref:SpoIIE family protein phosphatase n=1 Tax=Cryomorpha ignava TaxID=101383 RepID=A0A7K3WKH6_9FLAO|nr:SpoIIE family protein phosphatase [Cryomorpha ignava]NEN22139.1 SpoIIE family protein phosphatase [Cryomorpha ignava]